MTGQAYPAVRPKDVASYVLGLPPAREQERIVVLLDTADSAISQSNRERVALAAFKESMSDALLSGRVRVPCA